jgi:hypothetical protein
MRGAPPERIRGSHLPDQGADLGVEGRASSGGTARDPSPILAEPSTLPSEHGVRSHDNQRLPPWGPDSGHGSPEQAVAPAELRAGRRSLVDGELLA